MSIGAGAGKLGKMAAKYGNKRTVRRVRKASTVLDAVKGASATAETAAAAASSVNETATERLVRSFGYDVLENSKLTNAKQLTAAMSGRPAVASSTQAAAPSAGAETAAERAANTASQTPAAQTAQQPAAATTQSTPAAVPQSQAAAPQGAAGSTGGGLLDRVGETWSRIAGTMRERAASRMSVEDRVAGMTMDQRYDRLQSQEKLLPLNQVARELATPNPTREQMVAHSEKAEETARRASIDGKEEGEKESGRGMWKKIGAGALTSAAIPHLIPEGLRVFAERVSNANRSLEKWNGAIATSYAQLDVIRMQTDWQTANNTSGSTVLLNQSLGSLIRELQPFREGTITLLNLIAYSVTEGARWFLAWQARTNPLALAAMAKLTAIEAALRKNNNEIFQGPVRGMMKDISDGKFVRPLNPPPKR